MNVKIYLYKSHIICFFSLSIHSILRQKQHKQMCQLNLRFE